VNPPQWLSDFAMQLLQLHRLLAESTLEFGHRVYYEALRFVAVHAATGAPDMVSSLDRQVIQKLLPRIHGARKRVEAMLCALGQFCLDLSYESGSAHPGAAIKFDPTKSDHHSPVLPLSFDKIRRMTVTLRANQFTSFTD
jgi:5-methylcytosine-specific restriction enzyme B